MNKNNYVVIMAGGVGSRFWPYSRNNFPKQFLDVLGIGKSLLQLTYHRFLNTCNPENIYIVSNENYKALIQEQLPDLSDDQILLEPERRNTAPCIAYAAYKIAKQNPEATMVVTPADHAIFMENVFVETVLKGMEEARNSQKLITIGITPNRPETGYGYIQFEDHDGEVKKVITFTEKPQLELAKKFLESGDFVWNAGIFIWHVEAIKEGFKKYLPEVHDMFIDIEPYYYTDKEQEHVNDVYAKTKSVSIDYGVMEKANNVYTMLGEFGWSDLGSWSSLHEIRNKDKNNNVVDGNAMLYNTDDCMVMGKRDKLIVIQGLKEYLVADSDDVLLICNKDDERQFRSFVADVKNEKGEKYI